MKKFLIITALLVAIAAAVTYVIIKSDKAKAVIAKRFGKKKDEDEELDPCECCENETCDGCDLVEDFSGDETEEEGGEEEAEETEESKESEEAEETAEDAE